MTISIAQSPQLDSRSTISETSSQQTTTAESQQHSSSQSGIAAIGINTTSLIFQIINFIILFILLKYFVFKPIVKMLDKRRNDIAQSLEDVKKITQQKADWEKEHEKLLDEMNKQSSQIILSAKKNAEAIKLEMINDAKKEQAEIVKNATLNIENAKQKSILEAQKELTLLIISATQKVSQKIIDGKTNQALIEKTLKDLS